MPLCYAENPLAVLIWSTATAVRNVDIVTTLAHRVSLQNYLLAINMLRCHASEPKVDPRVKTENELV